MPLIVINTNIQKSSIPEGFLKGFSKVFSEAVGREEKGDRGARGCILTGQCTMYNVPGAKKLKKSVRVLRDMTLFLPATIKPGFEGIMYSSFFAINCSLFSGVEMIRNGTDDPACVITIRNTVSQDTDGRRATNKKLLDYMQTQLKLTDDIMTRFHVVFLTPGRDEIGISTGLLCDKK